MVTKELAAQFTFSFGLDGLRGWEAGKIAHH